MAHLADAAPPHRARCARCDAPIYSDEDRCHYCGGRDEPADSTALMIALLAVMLLAVLTIAILART